MQTSGKLVLTQLVAAGIIDGSVIAGRPGSGFNKHVVCSHVLHML